MGNCLKTLSNATVKVCLLIFQNCVVKTASPWTLFYLLCSTRIAFQYLLKVKKKEDKQKPICFAVFLCHFVWMHCTWLREIFHERIIEIDKEHVSASLICISLLQTTSSRRQFIIINTVISPDERGIVCVEILLPSQPNEVMSSAVILPNHTFTWQA